MLAINTALSIDSMDAGSDSSSRWNALLVSFLLWLERGMWFLPQNIQPLSLLSRLNDIMRSSFPWLYFGSSLRVASPQNFVPIEYIASSSSCSILNMDWDWGSFNKNVAILFQASRYVSGIRSRNDCEIWGRSEDLKSWSLNKASLWYSITS